jgi:pilus assembly protein CpaE
VLNFADERGGLSLSDVEATLGIGVDLQLPRSKAALESVNQGVPLLQSKGRDPMTKQLAQLVARFTPPAAPEKTSRRARALAKKEASVESPQARRAAPRWYRVRRAANG